MAHRFVAKATLGMALAVFVLTGCQSESDDPDPAPTPSEAPSPTPSETDSPGVSGDIVGEWEDPDAEWTVRFREDGTFVEDYQGITEFRTGDYEVKDDSVLLIGGDGNTDEGAREGDTLVFNLGTLTRK